MSSPDLSSFVPFNLDLQEQIEVLKKTKNLTLVNLGNIPARSFIINQFFELANFENIFWASTDEKIDQIYSSAETFFKGHIHQVPRDMTMGQFYELKYIAEKKTKSLFLFEDLESILEKNYPTQKEIDLEKVTIKKGQKIQIFELFERLSNMGYSSAEDDILNSGEFVRKGENFFIYPENKPCCYRVQLYNDEIESIEIYPQSTDKDLKAENVKNLEILPIKFETKCHGKFLDVINGCSKSLFISDDLDKTICPQGDFFKIKFTTFPDDNEKFFHLNFFSVLPFYTIQDFVVDIKERLRREFNIVLMTKKSEEIEKIFRDNEIMFTEDMNSEMPSTVKLKKIERSSFLPHSFQNNTSKLFFLTDREIFKFQRSSRQKKAVAGMNFDLMTSLKPGDFVVHADHGLAKFDGIERKEVALRHGIESGKEDLSSREYLKLCYAAGDKLFVPVESAEKITKFIGDSEPKLTRLGSSEWQQSKKKLKVEAEKIAKELLNLYARRELAKGKRFLPDDEMMKEFCESFPYELTPGQNQSWNEIKTDMEAIRPMDRLLCGDVGFGKTEMAMRATFKCFRSGMQAVILAPITILAEQHFQSFKKRIVGKNYNLRIELLSRFQSPKEQKEILADIKHGLVDIVIGTHRLLSDDINFKKLGLIVIDEEQRFGVKQKEKLKELRTEVDILTMTATPIPRTLNMGLNKLKDISTITTPPPGRLPIVTEVRKYGPNLIRDRILFEIKRKGQIYFLHNRVETIEAQTQQLKSLVPEAKFIIAHGQLSASELEERINKFKSGEIDVLVASTIIENGIDLPNANTLFVNHAERFGLSQLYQLRGRVGRRRTQAYAFFLYHGQRLELEAKKRLRAIVEASELGSGFQIAMRDMEIRGAGEVLGASQSGTIKTVGVSHFMQMLNRTVEEMKSGEVSTVTKEEENITVEVPISAFIPSAFIPNTHEKIQVYKELASAQNKDQLNEFKRDLREDYGTIPLEVENLCKVIHLKILLREVNLEGVKIYRLSHTKMEVVLRMGREFSPDQLFGLIQQSQNKWVITAQAIKLKLPKLPVSWYEDLVKDIKLLMPPKKKKEKIIKN